MLDGRFLHRWGRGNALTVGYTAYTSRSPYNQYSNPDPFADRDDESGKRTYGNERRTNYAAIFAENVFRFRYFHLVTSARFDHEELKADETVANHANLVDATYRKNIPLFGIGIGNDFGHGNETYLNISQGFRPLRYLDIASPFTNYSSGNNPDPTQYVTYEAGVHGWPKPGLYYDASVFQVNVHDRIEAQISFTQAPAIATVDVNTGNTRSRGVELEGWYDLLRLWSDAPEHRHIDVFANATYLNARFTSSNIAGQAGKTPAYAPDYVFKTGVTLRQDKLYKASLIVDSVASQFFQDSNAPILPGRDHDCRYPGPDSRLHRVGLRRRIHDRRTLPRARWDLESHQSPVLLARIHLSRVGGARERPDVQPGVSLRPLTINVPVLIGRTLPGVFRAHLRLTEPGR